MVIEMKFYGFGADNLDSHLNKSFYAGSFEDAKAQAKLFVSDSNRPADFVNKVNELLDSLSSTVKVVEDGKFYVQLR
jgi:hypothetical protein